MVLGFNQRRVLLVAGARLAARSTRCFGDTAEYGVARDHAEA